MGHDTERQVAELIAAIQALEKELEYPAADPATGLAVPKISLERAKDLKGEVDRFRMFLWAYIDARSENASTASKLRDIRIACISDLLAALSRDVQREGAPPRVAVERLLEEMDHIGKLLPAAVRTT